MISVLNVCRLCRISHADKRNSHIISKFLGKKLFEGVIPRHTLIIEPSGESIKAQDTFKEDYIFCAGCEKRFEILETLVSKRLYDLSNFLDHPEHFELKKIGVQEFIECKQLDSKELIIFIYSILWRVSISKLEAFKNFQFDKATEKYIREILDNTLSNHNSKLKDKIESLKLDNQHTIVLIKPKNKSSKFRRMQTSLKLSENLYHLYLSEIIAVFYSSKTNVHSSHSFFGLKSGMKPTIPIADVDSWNTLIQIVFNKTVQQ